MMMMMMQEEILLTENEHMIEKLYRASCITPYKIQTAADEMYIQVLYVFKERAIILYLRSLSNA